jgi:hypothetical protein
VRKLKRTLMSQDPPIFLGSFPRILMPLPQLVARQLCSLGNQDCLSAIKHCLLAIKRLLAIKHEYSATDFRGGRQYVVVLALNFLLTKILWMLLREMEKFFKRLNHMLLMLGFPR